MIESWHQKNPEYLAKYYQDHKEKKDATKREWRLKNAERDRAHRRIRLLSGKEEQGKLSEGEMEQMLELARKFPKRIMS